MKSSVHHRRKSGNDSTTPAVSPFLPPAFTWGLSLVFLLGLAFLLWRASSSAHIVEADIRPASTPQADARPGRYYTVQFGDTLVALSQRFYHDGGLWQRLATVNEIEAPEKLMTGRVIWIPHLPKADRR